MPINRKGQSLIELIMVLPILIGFWAAMVWFAQAVIVSIELLNTARHGVFWLAYHDDRNLSTAQEAIVVENECRVFLRREAPALAAHMSQVLIRVQPGDRWEPVGPRSLVDVAGLIRMVTHLQDSIWLVTGLLRFQYASVEVTYSMPAPPLLQAIPGFPPTIPLRGYCVCYR
jgi:hypothetical protein